LWNGPLDVCSLWMDVSCENAIVLAGKNNFSLTLSWIRFVLQWTVHKLVILYNLASMCFSIRLLFVVYKHYIYRRNIGTCTDWEQAPMYITWPYVYKFVLSIFCFGKIIRDRLQQVLASNRCDSKYSIKRIQTVYNRQSTAHHFHTLYNIRFLQY